MSEQLDEFVANDFHHLLAGERAVMTCWPTAFSRMWSINS